MADAYTFEKSGDGYRFTVVGGRTAGGAAGRGPTRTGSVLLAAGAWLLVLMFARSPLFLLIFGGLAVYLTFRAIASRSTGQSATAAGASGTAGPSFFVGRSELVTVRGVRVSANRINDVEVKNNFDQGYRVPGQTMTTTHVSTGLASATSNAALGISSAIGQGLANKRAQTAFYVSVQHGGSEDRVVENLNQNAARGLQADILRILRGDSLD